MCDECCCRCRCGEGLIVFGVIFGALVFAVLLAAFGFVRPPPFVVDDASLTRFNLSAATSSFAYNLTVTLVAHNPNWAMAAKNTKQMDVEYRFDGQVFERIQLAGKGDKLRPGRTVVHRLSSGSESALVPTLGNAGVVEYRDERAKGTFDVEVAVAGEVRYTARYTKCKIEATCPLKLQLAPPGTTAVAFQKVKCKLASREKNC
uniref:Late embryogenesis abundant protein LEA-2 subgroup domain-containing protein n=1 Tax=Oryza brachyantha TaxID=4533 RepID=J3MJS7_ORYBR